MSVTDDEQGTRNAELMGAFWEAAEQRDFDALARLVDPEVVMEWPQSGERFVGLDNALGALQAQDEAPEIAGEPRLVGCGDVWVAQVPLRYGETTYQYVGIFEMAEGKIRRTTEYFGAPFPPKPARAPFAESVLEAEVAS